MTARARAAAAPVIEITGPTCSGKTHLLYYITAIGVLPRYFRQNDIKGKQGAVVVLDSDGRFDVSRLRQVMRCYIVQQRSETEPEEEQEEEEEREMDTILYTSLTHVHIFRPDSMASVLATIELIPNYLLHRNFPNHHHFSSSRALHAIMWDSASAFYWQDRLDESSNNGRSSRYYTAILHALRSVQSQFDCLVISTTWALNPSTQSHLLLLPRPWSSFATLRLFFFPLFFPVTRYPANVSAQEAYRSTTSTAITAENRPADVNERGIRVLGVVGGRVGDGRATTEQQVASTIIKISITDQGLVILPSD